LIGYSDRPTAMQLCVYLAVLAASLLLMRAVKTSGLHLQIPALRIRIVVAMLKLSFIR
jgi:hypothetical protein